MMYEVRYTDQDVREDAVLVEAEFVVTEPGWLLFFGRDGMQNKPIFVVPRDRVIYCAEAPSEDQKKPTTAKELSEWKP